MLDVEKDKVAELLETRVAMVDGNDEAKCDGSAFELGRGVVRMEVAEDVGCAAELLLMTLLVLQKTGPGPVGVVVLI